MALDAVTDGATLDPDTDDRDETDSDQGDAGTPAAHEDEDLQSPPLNADELPAH